MSDNIFALGWDVGGWMGKNNSFVLVEICDNRDQLKWFFSENNFQIKHNELFNLNDVFKKLYKKDLPEKISLAIGIDAPLTFPREFINFLTNRDKYISKPEKEIFNHLAYRRTDRYIYKKYGKKPLSATFDRLGNNATVAISHIRYWSKDYNIEINQDKFLKEKINIIESYPALLKPKKYERAFNKIDQIIPDEIFKGTDQYDAALCALMAAQFGSENSFKGLPKLKYPPSEEEIYKKEGWIYHFKIEDIKKLRR